MAVCRAEGEKTQILIWYGSTLLCREQGGGCARVGLKPPWKHVQRPEVSMQNPAAANVSRERLETCQKGTWADAAPKATMSV